jgi:hypothetical protein
VCVEKAQGIKGLFFLGLHLNLGLCEWFRSPSYRHLLSNVYQKVEKRVVKAGVVGVLSGYRMGQDQRKVPGEAQRLLGGMPEFYAENEGRILLNPCRLKFHFCISSIALAKQVVFL